MPACTNWILLANWLAPFWSQSKRHLVACFEGGRKQQACQVLGEAENALNVLPRRYRARQAVRWVRPRCLASGVTVKS